MTATIDMSTATTNFSGVFAFSEPVPPPEPTYAEWFHEKILRSRWITYILAFYLHLVAIVGLAAIFFQAPQEFEPVTLNAVISDAEFQESTAMEIITTELEESPTEDLLETREALNMSASTDILMPDLHTLDTLPESLAALSTSALSSAESAKPGHRPKAAKVGIKSPRNAVTAGSFSVWTEPENPDPGEPYKIVVQIRVPDDTDKYPVTDLDGVVVGSDGYQKMIPGNVHGFLPVENGHVRFEVHIVSADENVQDTVFVRSKVLREAQKLQLRF
ncbi:MAG: hypothetical protein R3C17_00875 [Planctomycetaceae bacterium]